MGTPEQTSPTRPFEPAEASATDPIALFPQWLDEAAKTEPNDPNAMALATTTPDGHPSVRMVLMKRLDDRGFAFYTNAESRKGAELAANPNVSLCFHWKTQRRQIRVDGTVEKLSPEDSDEYFHSRSRRSQIGAVASNQSHPLASRQHLEREAEALAARFPDVIPRPDYWCGFVVRPIAIEFWQDGPDRLHDRMLYTRAAGGWTRTRLYP